MVLDLLRNILISVLMVISTTCIFYEILRLCWEKLPKLKTAPRKRIIFVVLTIFFAHTVSIWTYGSVYYLMVEHLNLGSFREIGSETTSYLSYIYYSAEVYASLGLGDLVPEGAFRFITGVEALNGLILIGWSVSFTYLAMEKFWVLHGKKN
jgi:hypothetical protein